MTDSEAATDGESAQEGSLRRIGRNLVNVQVIEMLLKRLLAVNFSAPNEEIEAHFKKHVERVSRMTMRDLITELAETVLLPADTEASQYNGKDVWIAISFNRPLDSEARSAWTKEWKTLRTERNNLVHLMLATVDFNSPEQCRKLNLDLDAQNVLFLKGMAFLREMVTVAHLGLSFMASDEFNSVQLPPGSQSK
jgi:hypothetical protein